MRSDLFLGPVGVRHALGENKALVARLGDSRRSVRIVHVSGLSHPLGEENALFDIAGTVRFLSRCGISVRDALRREKAFPCFPRLTDPFAAVFQRNLRDAMDIENALVRHSDLGDHLVRAPIANGSHFLWKEDPPSLNCGLQCKRKLSLRRANRSFDEQKVVLAFLAGGREVPVLLVALDECAGFDRKSLTAMLAIYIARLEPLLAGAAHFGRILPFSVHADLAETKLAAGLIPLAFFVKARHAGPVHVISNRLTAMLATDLAPLSRQDYRR